MTRKPTLAKYIKVKFRVVRDGPGGKWSAWPVTGVGDVVGPCDSLDVVFAMATNAHPLGCILEIVTDLPERLVGIEGDK